MKEYYFIANSCAAPFFSDTSDGYIKAENPKLAAEKVIKRYNHPAGLFALEIHKSHRDYSQGNKFLYRFLSEKAKKQNVETPGK